MTEYGLRIRDASGNIISDSSSQHARLVYSTIALANVSGNVTLDELDGINTVCVGVSLSGSGMTHNVTRNGNVFTWTARNEPINIHSTDTVVFIFAYD